MLASSRMTQKFQATIPARVREILGLRKGDLIGFAVENGNVILRKAAPLDVAFAKALEGTLSEWATEEDEEAFRGL
jgi:antitoxin PrlF